METLFTAILLLASSAATQSVSRCKEVSFQVSGTAQNKNLTGIPLTSLNALVNFYNNASTITVTGKQTIAGTYCAPSTINANNEKLEVLFGSILTNRGSWSAQGGIGTDFDPYQPELYSWVDFANQKGYATLSVDRLGNGRSSHPDPTNKVQAPYEIALYNDLAQQIRAGTNGQLPRKYSDLTYVGNSYGSQLGGGVANAYPNAYNRFLLTGFTYNFQQDFVGVSYIGAKPAREVNSTRFGTLDPGYLTASVEKNLTNSFFGSHQQVDFDDAVSLRFFQREDTLSIGQFASVYAITYSAPAYKGPIFVLDGEQDQAVCGPGSPTIGPANCGPQLQQSGQRLYPNSNFNWKSVNRTGHAIQLFLTSQKVFDIAHRWLGGEVFLGGTPA